MGSCRGSHRRRPGPGGEDRAHGRQQLGSGSVRRRWPQPPRHRSDRPPLPYRHIRSPSGGGQGGAPLSRDLRPLFNPRSLAILGASKDPAKWGYALSRNALKGRHRRKIFLVNRNGDEILGEPSYRSMRELPESPELVVITIRAAGFEAAVNDALAAGARAIVAITAGLGERDAAGLALQQAAAARCREAGTILVGPNCLGIADLTTELDLTWDDFGPGAVALVSQSGNVGLELAQHAHYFRVGFSRFVSLGNQADLNAGDCVEDLIDHEGTRVIAVYIEDFGDGRQFASLADKARLAGKPVILLTVGETAASRRTARSHTGALVSESLAVDAACRAAGIYRVQTPLQMIDLAQMLLMPYQPRGSRISIIGDGGGHVALAADRLAAHGLRVEPFSDRVSQQLARVLPSTATSTNPVDIAGGGEEDIWTFERAVRGMVESGEADAVLLTGYFGGYSEHPGPYATQELEVAETMMRDASNAGCPLIVQTMYPRSPTSAIFRRHAIPVFADIEAPARALGIVVDQINNPPLSIPPPLALKSPPPLGEGRVRASDYFVVRQLLIDAGIPFAEARPVATEEAAVAAADEIGYPIVLKALGMTHKSDVGGVRLAIPDAAAIREAFRHLQTSLRPSQFSVEREAPIELGVELLVGVKRDRSFGPIALAGLGGVHAEVFRDVAVALAPVTQDQAIKLICRLEGSELLLGRRGRPRLDVEGAALALRTLSEVAASRPDIVEIEVNPILVLSNRVLGLDARLALRIAEDKSL
ncbi:MAG: CoA-binding protein [Chloroflexi bacterium]|nr:MAG: CoA-binding protein [Chloroflexota bacterium]